MRIEAESIQKIVETVIEISKTVPQTCQNTKTPFLKQIDFHVVM